MGSTADTPGMGDQSARPEQASLEGEAAHREFLVIERASFPLLLHALQAQGYEIVGPTVREGAIVYAELQDMSDLPIGWTDDQDAGRYRLRRRDDDAVFGYNVGPHSWKQLLHPPALTLARLRRTPAGFEATPERERVPKRAFVGVRACELHAIAIQDRVLLGGPYADPNYRARREGTFVVAVNCAQAGGTCFCVSMRTGPRVTFGYDLTLTEVLAAQRHYFVVQVGSTKGAALMAEVPHTQAGDDELLAAERVIAQTAAHMGRALDTTGIQELLQQRSEHPRWEQVSQRCLTCGNCTMVCPTCFCTSVQDVTDLTGVSAERVRRWESCFTVDFTYVHGGSVRQSSRSRYRQWLTHKFSTWFDQFGSSGCVGCGRCITWCPVGIDVTEEVSAICADEAER